MEPTAIEHHEESQGNHVYDNLAVEHQLSADRNDMLAPGTTITPRGRKVLNLVFFFFL